MANQLAWPQWQQVGDIAFELYPVHAGLLGVHLSVPARSACAPNQSEIRSRSLKILIV
ncbi:hypothetical protein DAI22_09g144050 [Oryza sativa Japonica Group]|nr:hypothetical protein DAI22_09g144050 [Oryza sativa Japonica Group]